MWTYVQDTGALYDPRHEFKAFGYSGNGEGKNNPALQHVKNVGPIPCGLWSIGGAFNSETKGPVVMRLTPWGGTKTFNREDFEIHGDAILHPGDASHGCIILGRNERLTIAVSLDRMLEVISSEKGVDSQAVTT